MYLVEFSFSLRAIVSGEKKQLKKEQTEIEARQLNKASVKSNGI